MANSYLLNNLPLKGHTPILRLHGNQDQREDGQDKRSMVAAIFV